MPGTPETDWHVVADIELKGPRCRNNNEPYNKFSIKYPVTKTLSASGEKKRDEERTLAQPKSLGLNPFWIHTRRVLVDQGTSKAQKATIRSLHTPEFPYWGHLIYNSIKEFNASSPNRCRKLVYDLRHGQADHNAWRKLFKNDEWSKVPEYRKQPIIEIRGKKFSIIDPPLTARGEQQAKDANAMFRQLKEHMFPMPKRAYISPLLRAMQTFKHALGHDPMGVGVRREDSYILKELREQETGNSADILFDEYISHSKIPRKPRTAEHEWYEEEDDIKVQERAASLHDEIFGMDDSDCILRVTHSLLIQNNLKALAVRGGTVLQNFMLAEGGLFAYVVEGRKVDEKKAKKLRNKKLEEESERLDHMGNRRKSAFPCSKTAPTKPVAVPIEREILAM
ncbi:hypothetical protein LA080_006556 [Diaporthe eres]|uniref:Uncharacterized protein n=1 Tax=Diaporthe vaccinii TaxID=105482 RepID=A0ABR4EP19_9PEZI|nr:hypothetical protein LA080_006556 [Diaporthe eres]